MENLPSIDCLVCRKHRGEVDIPGGVIFENDLIYISHAQLWGEEKEHYADFALSVVKSCGL